MRLVPIIFVVSLAAAVGQPPYQPALIRGAPFSADEVQEFGADRSAGGETIGHFFRDSEGRIRTENALKAGGWSIEILDPVAGVAYVCSGRPEQGIARRRPIEEMPPSSGSARNATIENLGTKVIDGLLAEGTRTTSALVIEKWDSVELKVNLLTKSSNGLGSKLVKLTRAEPDPALFGPPADYKVVDQHQGVH